MEIFSNTHQEWYRGEIVEIIKDEEGEWLNVVWARNNGEAMSKQVQRFSTDVRPAQDDSDSDPGGTDSLTDRYRREIMARQNGNFVRNAPLFSRTIQASNFTNPASGAVRNKKRLTDIEEKEEVCFLYICIFLCVFVLYVFLLPHLSQSKNKKETYCDIAYFFDFFVWVFSLLLKVVCEMSQ